MERILRQPIERRVKRKWIPTKMERPMMLNWYEAENCRIMRIQNAVMAEAKRLKRTEKGQRWSRALRRRRQLAVAAPERVS